MKLDLLFTTPWALPALAGGLLLLYAIASSLASWYRLRKFKGPRFAGFSYWHMMSAIRSGDAFRHYYRLTREYGPVVRIGPNDLLTSDAEILARMNAARSPYKRSSWYSAMRLDPYFDTMGGVVDKEVHAQLKSKTAGAYTGRDLPTLEADMDSQIVALKDALRRRYVSTDAETRLVDLGGVIEYYTLDTLSKAAFGQPFGFLDKNDDIDGLLETVKNFAPTTQFLGDCPPLARVFTSQIFLRLFGPKDTDKTGVGALMGKAKTLAEERFSGKIEAQDMLGSFVAHGLDQRTCQTEIILLVLSESDTSATAIRATLLFLMTSPTAYRKLQQEIDEAIADGRVAGMITQKESVQLPYLQACINECLRLWPAFTGLIMKEVGPGGDVLGGVYAPPGTRVGACVYGTLRDRSVFGDDADLFRPERWLGLARGGDKEAAMLRQLDHVFGAGRYGCAGKLFARAQLNKIFFELLRDFDFQIVDPTRPWHSVNYGLHLQEDFWARVTERKHD